eukprot:10979979-Lingulodinium_polyedra.AAC.1
MRQPAPLSRPRAPRGRGGRGLKVSGPPGDGGVRGAGGRQPRLGPGGLRGAGRVGRQGPPRGPQS